MPDNLTGEKPGHTRDPQRLTESQALATYQRWYNGLCRKSGSALKASARKNRAKLQHLVVKEGQDQPP